MCVCGGGGGGGAPSSSMEWWDYSSHSSQINILNAINFAFFSLACYASECPQIQAETECLIRLLLNCFKAYVCMH